MTVLISFFIVISFLLSSRTISYAFTIPATSTFTSPSNQAVSIQQDQGSHHSRKINHPTSHPVTRLQGNKRQIWTLIEPPVPDLIKYYTTVSTCGYVDADRRGPFVCGLGSTCAIANNRLGPLRACCAEASCITTFGCINSADYRTLCTGSCELDKGIVKCLNSQFPFCHQHDFIGAWGTAPVWRCYPNPPQMGHRLGIYTTHFGEQNSRQWETVTEIEKNPRTTSKSQTNSTSILSLNIPSTPESHFSSVKTPKPTHSKRISSYTTTSSHKPTSIVLITLPSEGKQAAEKDKFARPAGGMIGGVVGGIALVGIIGCAIYYIHRGSGWPNIMNSQFRLQQPALALNLGPLATSSPLPPILSPTLEQGPSGVSLDSLDHKSQEMKAVGL